MSQLEDLRGTVNELYRQLNLISLVSRIERDDNEQEKLQRESLELQKKLREAEAALGQELKKASAATSRMSQKPRSGGTDERPGGTDERMGAATTGLDAQVDLRMLNVPTSMVHLLARERRPLVTVRVRNAGSTTRRIRVTTCIEGFTAQAIGTRELSKGETGVFDQFPAFFPERVKAVTELTMAALHVHVEDLDGKTELHETYPIPLLARTTAVLSAPDPSTGNPVDLMHLLAAWVTPNAPEVLDMVRRAADISSLKGMFGYQVDAARVREHVRAIFTALKESGIVYVNSPVSFGNHEGQFIQRIRLPRESLKDRSANCIDGTVLMASMLEVCALDAAIILVPGHAYLGWRPERAQQGKPDTWNYVETTMIGNADFEAACKHAEVATAWHLDEMKKDPARTYVRVLSIPALRASGVSPME